MNNKDAKNNLKLDLPIRQVMAELKDDLYVIVNPELNALEELAKSLYLRVLGSIIQYEDEPSEMQSLYFKRIAKGMTKEESPEEIMRKALEISADDIRDFVGCMQDNPARFYFALDAAVLTALGGASQAGCEYQAEMLEIIGITKSELQCIALIAKSVIAQQPSFYDEAKPLLLNDLAQADFSPYLGHFYTGQLQNSTDLQVFTAPSQKDSSKLQYPTNYTARRVSFSNLAINISAKWTFDCCEEVRFNNCSFDGTQGTNPLYFRVCRNVEFSGCKFVNFNTNTIIAVNVGENGLIFTDCEFNNCCSDSFSDSGRIRNENGRVIFVNRAKHDDSTCEVIIRECKFHNCITNTDVPNLKSPISNANCIVKNSQFINCGIILNNRNSMGPKVSTINEDIELFEHILKESNNETRGSGPIQGRVS